MLLLLQIAAAPVAAAPAAAVAAAADVAAAAPASILLLLLLLRLLLPAAAAPAISADAVAVAVVGASILPLTPWTAHGGGQLKNINHAYLVSVASFVVLVSVGSSLVVLVSLVGTDESVVSFVVLIVCLICPQTVLCSLCLKCFWWPLPAIAGGPRRHGRAPLAGRQLHTKGTGLMRQEWREDGTSRDKTDMHTIVPSLSHSRSLATAF